MQSIGLKRPQAEKISSEPPPKPKVQKKMHGLDVSVKDIDQESLKMCNLNPLFPEARSALRFSIDRVTHEELRSSGLEVKILKQHTIRSYMNIREESIRGTLDYSSWIKNELSDKVNKFFPKYPYYLIELNINNRASLESHIRYTKKDHSEVILGNQGESLGFVTFNENPKDKDWLDVHGIYISPKYQKLGLATFLVRTVAGVGLSNNKQGVEFDDPFFWGNSSFYRDIGIDLIRFSPRHSYGCAQLKLINDDGSQNTLHQLLPKPSEYPLEFKKMKGSDPMALL